jgi:hypothetical protein
MKKFLFRIAVCLMAVISVISLTACNDTKDETSFTLPTTETVAVGESKSITLVNTTTVSGIILWKSSDTTIATVDSSGKVTGIAAGSASISASLGTNSAACLLTVTGSASTSFSLPLTKALTVGTSETITLTNTTGTAAAWNSDNTSIATVDSTGKVTPISAGTCKITATAGTNKAVCTITVTAAASSNGPISTAAEFQSIANNLNGTYYLTNDIDFAGATIDPIGTWGDNTENANTFKGSFDGKGYTLKNFTLNSAHNTSSAGTFGVSLFTYVGAGATIKNLSVVGCTTSGDGFIGAIVGKNSGTISNCYVDATIGYTANTTSWLVWSGTIAGINAAGATVTGCVVKSHISSWGGVYHLVGCNWGTLSNCYAISDYADAQLNAAERINDQGIKEILILATNSAILSSANSLISTSYANLSTSAWTITNGSIPTLIKA